MCKAAANTKEEAGRWALISTEGGERLGTYTYRGKDLSLAYKHFLSPLAEKCLIFTPRWLAPNLITFLGLLISIAGSLAFWWACPDWESENCPRWVFPVMGGALFIYQTLDNMDGKQARRTGTGSALGLLFDHGCDAVNATFGAFILIAISGAGRSLPVVAACYGNNAVPFFFATWEHYYTDELVLPIINGPSEGVLIGVALTVITYFVGPSFWATQLPLPPLPSAAASWLEARFGAEAARAPPLWGLMLAGSYVMIAMTVVVQTVKVLRRQRQERRSLLAPLKDTLGFAFIWGAGGHWLATNPELFARHPAKCLFLFGALNTEVNIALMLAHVTGECFHPFRPIVLPLLLAWVNSCVLSAPVLDETALLMACTYLANTYTAAYAVKAALEMRDHLGIYVFSTKKRKMS